MSCCATKNRNKLNTKPNLISLFSKQYMLQEGTEGAGWPWSRCTTPTTTGGRATSTERDRPGSPQPIISCPSLQTHLVILTLAGNAQDTHNRVPHLVGLQGLDGVPPGLAELHPGGAEGKLLWLQHIKACRDLTTACSEVICDKKTVRPGEILPQILISLLSLKLKCQVSIVSQVLL